MIIVNNSLVILVVAFIVHHAIRNRIFLAMIIANKLLSAVANKPYGKKIDIADNKLL